MAGGGHCGEAFFYRGAEGSDGCLSRPETSRESLKKGRQGSFSLRQRGLRDDRLSTPRFGDPAGSGWEVIKQKKRLNRRAREGGVVQEGEGSFYYDAKYEHSENLI